MNENVLESDLRSQFDPEKHRRVLTNLISFKNGSNWSIVQTATIIPVTGKAKAVQCNKTQYLLHILNTNVHLGI